MLQIVCNNARVGLGVRQAVRLRGQRPSRFWKNTSTPQQAHARIRRSSASSKRQQSTAFVSEASSSSSSSAGLTRTWREALHDVLLKPRTLPIPRWISPTHHTTTLSETLGHSSFILVAASYAVDDFLNLRIIAVAGSTAMLCFTYFHPHGRVLWLPFKWNLLFILINSYRIGKVFWDRFLADSLLGEELRELHQNHFFVLDPVDFSKLVRSAREEHFRKGDLVVSQGSLHRYIRLVVQGELEAIRDGIPTYTLEEGNFVSEAGLHAGLMLHGRVESCCTIVAACDTHVLTWERNELMDLLGRETMLRRSLKAALSWDIVRKLKGQREMLALGKIQNEKEWTRARNDQNRHRYASILQNLLQHPASLRTRQEELNKYRMIHHIDDEAHRDALEKCGWTIEEFEQGYKEGLEDEPDDEIPHDWRWRMHDLYMRLFG